MVLLAARDAGRTQNSKGVSYLNKGTHAREGYNNYNRKKL